MTIADTKKLSSGPKKPKSSARAYPTFYEMTTDAIVTLKERTGSSQYAITKFIEEKHKKDQLPSNFKKLLLIQLKKFVASGRLVKVKNSYKLPSALSFSPTTRKPVKEAATAPKSKAKVGEAAKKRKAVTEGNAKVKPAAKKAKTSSKVTPSAKPQKRGVKVVAKPKKVALAKAPKPKSVKSPAKKKATPKKTSK